MPRLKSGHVALILGASTLMLYAFRLDLVPPFLKYEEVFFALESRALATTWRDTHGRFLPVYFQVYENAWYQPVLAYWGALFQWLLPLSDTTIRLPSACVGAINVTLVYCIARRIFGSIQWAALAGLVLAMTPPHLILSRVAMDYVYPLPFTLGWFLSLLIYIETRSLRALAAGACLLGVGFFSYIAAVGLMPVFFVATLITIAMHEPRRVAAFVTATVCFGTLLLAGLWVAFQTPEYVAATMGRYGQGLAGPGSGDPLQRLRELANYTSVSTHVGLLSEFFNAGYLFFSGGTNPVDSTRTAGVFLLPAAVFIPAGIYAALRERTVPGALIVAGFFYAPVPAATIMERYTIDRHMVMLPFAALLTTYGVRKLWTLPLRHRMASYLIPIGTAGMAVVVLYAIYTLIDRGVITKSTVPLAIASIVLMMLARAADRARHWSVITAALLVFGAAQFAYFARDYFTDYRMRTTTVFGSNLRGAIEAAIESATATPAKVHVSREIPFADYYVRLYSAVADQPAFAGTVTYFLPAGTTAATVDGPSLYLTGLGAEDTAFVRRNALTIVATVVDPTGEPAFVLSRPQ